MAAQDAGKLTPARTSRATTQTIEQIEQRTADLAAAERYALRLLAEFLRELAVHLPAESHMPLTFAKAATTLGHWFDDGEPDSGAWVGMRNVTEDLRQRFDLGDEI